MVNFVPLKAEISSEVWDTPANFNGFRVLPSLLQRRRSPEANQTLHNVWPSPGLVHYYIHFRRLLSPDGILTCAKFTLRPSLAFSYGSITTRAGVSQTLRRGTRNGITKLSQRAPPIFGCRVAITMGIGPHSSYITTCDLAKIDRDLNQSFNG